MRFVYISNDGEAEAGKGDDAGGAGQVEEDHRGQHLSQGEDLEGGKSLGIKMGGIRFRESYGFNMLTRRR